MGAETPSMRWFKKRAKARSEDAKHSVKLYLTAREAGFASWGALLQASEADRQTAINRLRRTDADAGR